MWRGLREDTPIKLTNEQATALSGRLYRAWASGEGRERTIAVEQGPDGKMQVVEREPKDDDVLFGAAIMRWVRPAAFGKVIDLDHLFLPLRRSLRRVTNHQAVAARCSRNAAFRP